MTSNKTSPTTLIIPKTVRDRARTLFDAGRIEDAWRVLADAGDDYAAEAARITGDRPNLNKSVVETLWDNAVGKAVRREKWPAVARRHGMNYVKIMEDKEGELPSLEEIESSYADSVVDSDLSKSIAIDLTLNSATRPFRVWDDMLGLNSDRSVGPGLPTAEVPRGTAFGLLGEAALFGVGDYVHDETAQDLAPAFRAHNDWQRGEETTARRSALGEAARAEMSSLNVRPVPQRTVDAILGIIDDSYAETVATNPKLTGQIAARVINNNAAETSPGLKMPIRKARIVDEFRQRLKAFDVPETLPTADWGKPQSKPQPSHAGSFVHDFDGVTFSNTENDDQKLKDGIIKTGARLSDEANTIDPDATSAPDAPDATRANLSPPPRAQRETLGAQSTLGAQTTLGARDTLDGLPDIDPPRTVRTPRIDLLGENAISAATPPAQSAPGSQPTLGAQPGNDAAQTTRTKLGRDVDTLRAGGNDRNTGAPMTMGGVLRRNSALRNRARQKFGPGKGFMGGFDKQQQQQIRSWLDDGGAKDLTERSDSSRVICTELVRQGLMAASLQRLDIAFTLKRLSPTTVRGYHFWAVPYARLMRRSPVATRIMLPIATWRALEIAHRMGERDAPHIRGKAVRAALEPLCWIIGRMIEALPGDQDRFHPYGIGC